MTETLYLLPEQTVPHTHYRSKTVVIPRLERESIAQLQFEPIDVTALLPTPSTYRFTCQLTTVTTVSGDRLRFSREEFKLAVTGGGKFVVAERNPLFNQPTEEMEEELDVDYDFFASL